MLQITAILEKKTTAGCKKVRIVSLLHAKEITGFHLFPHVLAAWKLNKRAAIQSSNSRPTLVVAPFSDEII